MAKFEIVPGLVYVDRETWGADPDHPRKGYKVGRDRRTHVIIHHTVMPDTSDASSNLWETEKEVFGMMRKLQTVRPDLGMDVPYSFVVFFMAGSTKIMVCEGRGEDRTGAHTKGHNSQGIGISFAGDFENKSIKHYDIAKRMFLVSYFLGWLKYSPSHPDYGTFKPMKNLGSMRPQDRAVYFHQDFKKTACPGKKLIPHVAQVSFIDPRLE
ncbi:MAG: N-acetylmuramoyl-L-alanine amidase [Candidatus Thiodiazotropha sp. (ex Myrtea sp. 'scaly one' KF741663)]|nr:N-acetylmuramoyl-L-alanine amidase [Candidatus Thiodiazotropha sp. (ex Myrtea sp. 'scaly one' KF741663)]